MSRPSRNSMLLGVIIASGVLLRLSFALRSDASIATHLFEDDSFFFFTVARNFALGHGFSVDNGAHLTNGFQPLISLVYASFFLISQDRWLCLRFCFIAIALIDSFAIYLIARCITMLQPDNGNKEIGKEGLIAATIYAFAFPFVAQSANGMETGLYSCLLLLTLSLWIELRQGNGRPILFGIVLGLLVLARIDAVLFVIALALFDWRATGSLKQPAIFSLIAFLVTLPWWFYSFLNFGSIFPTSGQAESFGASSIGENIIHLFTTLADVVSILFALPFYQTNSLEHVTWIMFGGILASLLIVKAKLFTSASVRYAVRALVPFMSVAIALAFIYTFFFHAPYFIPRYLQPLRIVTLILFAIAIPDLRTRLRTPVIRAFAIVFLVGGAFFSVLNYYHVFVHKGTSDLYLAGLWARDHPDEKIGMLQSGTASFVADNVINLDGKVNADAMSAIQHDSLGRYIKSAHITVLMDWKKFAEELVSASANAGGNFRLVDSIDLIRIYKKIN